METAHAATPMMVRMPQPSNSPAYTIVDANGNYVAHIEIRSHNYADRDAAFIVRACNRDHVFDDLVNALFAARSCLDPRERRFGSAQDQIDVALAKAGATQPTE